MQRTSATKMGHFGERPSDGSWPALGASASALVVPAAD
jgi:hypothetical protein